MPAVRFTIGQENRVRFNLPSRASGDSTTLVGRVTIDVRAMKCSLAAQFRMCDLRELAQRLRECGETLRGEFFLEATSGVFTLAGHMGPHGQVRLRVVTSAPSHAQRDETHWDLDLRFSCPAAVLVAAADQVGVIE